MPHFLTGDNSRDFCVVCFGSLASNNSSLLACTAATPQNMNDTVILVPDSLDLPEYEIHSIHCVLPHFPTIVLMAVMWTQGLIVESKRDIYHRLLYNVCSIVSSPAAGSFFLL